MKLQQRVTLFQQRLQQMIAQSGLNRSTLSQLLASENARQPRADTLVFDAATNI